MPGIAWSSEVHHVKHEHKFKVKKMKQVENYYVLEKEYH